MALEEIAVLHTEKVKKYYDGLKAVDDVTLEAKPKQITLLIGPNGSGKTTFINVVSGYCKPDSGKVYFNGDDDITGWSMHKVYEKGLVRTFQIPRLFQGLTVLENLLVARRKNPGESLIEVFVKNRWVKSEEKAVEKALNVMKVLDLEEFWDSQITALPAGHLKLVEIGRALMSDAKMIILDEPIGGVNPALADKIFTYIQKLKKIYGLTFLIIEHRLDIALKYADYIYVMHQGRIISQGKMEKVVEDPLVKEVYIGG